MIGASSDSVVMVEGEMNEISGKRDDRSTKFGHEQIKLQCKAQIELSEKLELLLKEM